MAVSATDFEGQNLSLLIIHIFIVLGCRTLTCHGQLQYLLSAFLNQWRENWSGQEAKSNI